ncbi:TetR/AcrR family transcriptional regulator [Halopseudomonas maritima]|uniref:TetR/AcrR family transcriptional regulator n=1 Tax=Halopseudomonas maritima TaxID=2918528 RepID=UPI001EE9E25D|nr:TetR/AcrR family transcriptional regulator [Halopseudomonas maritima]UJJ30188.1 TetR/AcrR family transcriptional regulator [Halopseudomonas maritima]
MTTPTRPKPNARPRIKDKRSAILRAALAVFAEGGVNGVPMPALANKAGVGTGTIYRYFSSKDVLVNQLFREQRQFKRDLLFDGLDRTLDAEAQFRLVWQRMIRYSREHPDTYRFLEMQDHRPYLDSESRQLEQRFFAPLVSQYRDYQAQGVYRSDLRAEVLMAMVWGCFANLIKCEREGLLTLEQADLDAACTTCWSMLTG